MCRLSFAKAGVLQPFLVEDYWKRLSLSSIFLILANKSTVAVVCVPLCVSFVMCSGAWLCVFERQEYDSPVWLLLTEIFCVGQQCIITKNWILGSEPWTPLIWRIVLCDHGPWMFYGYYNNHKKQCLPGKLCLVWCDFYWVTVFLKSCFKEF